MSSAQGQFGGLEILDPKTYRAPSGKFAITVDPSEQHGRGEASYRCLENGQEKWSATLPFTLWDAGITDSGVVGGYAYTHGYSGIRDPGDFIVVILGQKGEILLKQVTPRQGSRFLHDYPDPKVRGLFVDEPNDRMVLRISDPDVNRAWESWWVYQLSTAALTSKLVPVNLIRDAKVARHIMDAKPVQNTPLTLVHWWRYDEQRIGARFTLLDLQAKPVWQLDLPTDYQIPGNEAAEGKLREWIRRDRTVLGSTAPGQFDIVVAAKKVKRSFSTQLVSGKWVVNEIAEVAYDPLKTLDLKPLNLPEASLTELGSITLQPGPATSKSPVHGIDTFTFDDQGRISFLRSHGHGSEAIHPPEFVQVDQQGKLLHEIPLGEDVKPFAGWNSCVWVGGTRFWITHSGGASVKSRAWWLDTKTRKMSEIAGFDCPEVERMLGFADGSAVAFASMHHKFTITSSLIAFDKSGRQVWERPDDYNEEGPDRLFGVEDIARTSRDEIPVLEQIGKKVKIFNRKGHIQREIDLEKSWKREPNYPTSITQDRDGGFIVEDFKGKYQFVQMKPDGSVLAEFTPKFKDGRIVDTSDGVHIAPDGRLWACDGECLVRLTDKGIVDLVHGKPPQTIELNRIAGVALDKNDQIYAVDARTGAVYVFDPAGKLRHVCKPQPDDFGNAVVRPTLTINDQGEVFQGLGDGMALFQEEREFSHFSVNGERLKNVTWPCSQCLVQPGTGNIIGIRFDEVVLSESTGKILKTIKRTSDRNWLRMLDQVEVGADGSIALLNRGSVCLYKSNGDPVRAIRLPDGIGILATLGYDGKRVAVTGERGLLLISPETGKTSVFHPPQWAKKRDAMWKPYFLANGRELLLHDEGESTFFRFKLPE